MLVNNNIDITIDVSHMCRVTIGRWSGCIKQGKHGPNETDDWLHKNDSLHANNIDDILISNQLSGN
jgi:hypothetical protein